MQYMLNFHIVIPRVLDTHKSDDCETESDSIWQNIKHMQLNLNLNTMLLEDTIENTRNIASCAKLLEYVILKVSVSRISNFL